MMQQQNGHSLDLHILEEHFIYLNQTVLDLESCYAATYNTMKCPGQFLNETTVNTGRLISEDEY